MERKPRLKDVAALTGLSTATVSLVLNEASDRFPPATVTRVREAARELGYTPNAQARSLRTNRSRSIGVITDNVLTSPFGFDMVRGAQDAAWDREYLLLLIGTEGDPWKQEWAVRELLARQADGLLIGSMYHRRLDLPRLPATLPVVGFNVVLEGYPSFVPDEIEAARKATALLVEAGHRSIAHITESPTDSIARDLRIQGFEGVLAEAGIRDRPVLDPGPDHATTPSVGAEEVAMELLARPDRPTAIFAFNDMRAVGIYRAARRLGLRIPEDLSIVSIDDQENIASELSPGLTTIALPHYDMGLLSTETLLDALTQGRPPTPGVTLVPSPAIVRGSIAAPAH